MTDKIVRLQEVEHRAYGDARLEVNDEGMDENTADSESDKENDFDTKIPDTMTPREDDINELERWINELPEDFPQALPQIRSAIAPVIAGFDGGMVEYYLDKLVKKTKAPKKAIVDEIEMVKKGKTSQELELTGNEEIDPEIQERVEEIKRDPLLFTKKIDTVKQMGIVGEEMAIGLNFVVLDSRLIPMGPGGSDALALKNSGQQGTGKSYPLLMSLTLYPTSAYHLITSGSSKSLYHLEEGLKHRTLVLIEALHLEAYHSGDTELAYSIRSLLSEGSLTYQYTGYNGEGKKVTILKTLEGPTSLLTTTVKGKLEPQLEDRLITVHPDASAGQTKQILSWTADHAAGVAQEVDKKTIEAWKLFHESLEPLDVVIPFARDIASYVNRNGSLPIAARRAFKRVLSAIKAVALSYQYQRQRDEQGRVIAEISDYAIVVQLINESFLESLGEEKRYTDHRIRVIEKEGSLTPRRLSKLVNVSVPALSPWIREKVKKGVLMWCDEKGNVFPDTETLEKAKHSGDAFVKVSSITGLPTPFQLTGNPMWDEEGELYQKYSLALENGEVDDEVFSDNNRVLDDTVEDLTKEDLYDFSNLKSSNATEEGVKVLGFNSVGNAENTIPDEEKETLVEEDPEVMDFGEELKAFLTI